MKDGIVISFTALRGRLSARRLEPIRIAVAVEPGRIDVLVPENARAIPRPACAAASASKPQREARPSFVEAVAGTWGAARALALDRYGNDGSSKRAVGLEQMLSLLRNAGHRVERVSPRLWSLDGRTANVGDLTEAANRIDADAVVVAEAA